MNVGRVGRVAWATIVCFFSARWMVNDKKNWLFPSKLLFLHQTTMMRRLLLLIVGCLTAVYAFGVKAFPFPVEVVQPDGTRLTVLLNGDEDFHYYTTTDGVLLVRHDDGSFFVGATDGEGRLTATRCLAHDAAARSVDERLLAQAQDRDRFVAVGWENAGRRKVQREPIVTSGTLFPHVGTPRAVVILADFKDVKFSIPNTRQVFDEYFNSQEPLQNHENGEASNLSSVAKYFGDVSFGKFVPQFDVYGPVTLPDSLKVYGGNNSTGDDENMGALLKNACSLLDGDIDFSQYDDNGDGFVDLVIVVYAGYSQAMSGNSNDCIWPKSGTRSAGPFDGKRVSRYAVNAELNGFPNCWTAPPYKRINGIGTLCHEFCHTMGMPDFYPTGKVGAKVKGNNQAMEFWSLMDSGNYLINGYAPCALNAWEREAFGWLDIPNLDGDSLLEIKPIDLGGTAYRIANDNDNTGCEYFIIENIQKIGTNQMQKGHGLLVYHVDYDPTLFSLGSNTVNNEKGHPRMTVVPADGLLFAQYNIGKKIDGVIVSNADFFNQLAGDPFPGNMGVTALNDSTGHVNFQVYKGVGLNKALDGIAEADGVVSLRFIRDYADYLEEMKFPSGDVNHDGEVDVVDVMSVVDVISVPYCCPRHADLNEDGDINVTDVMGIVGIILKKG